MLWDMSCYRPILSALQTAGENETTKGGPLVSEPGCVAYDPGSIDCVLQGQRPNKRLLTGPRHRVRRYLGRGRLSCKQSSPTHTTRRPKEPIVEPQQNPTVTLRPMIKCKPRLLLEFRYSEYRGYSPSAPTLHLHRTSA
jgi:hypothetical protein